MKPRTPSGATEARPVRVFQTDPSWYEDYWYGAEPQMTPHPTRQHLTAQARAHAARTIARFVAASIARFGRWAVNMVRARELLSSIPAEGSPYVPFDAVRHAKSLLLGETTKDREKQ